MPNVTLRREEEKIGVYFGGKKIAEWTEVGNILNFLSHLREFGEEIAGTTIIEEGDEESGSSGSISNEDIDDRVAALLVAGTNVTLTYDDGAGTLTIDAAGTLPGPHASSHENGGGDEIDVTGLSGVLADPQTPDTHTHVKADITDFAHTHVKADITDFAHTHVKADITDFAHTHPSTDITDFDEAVDDRVGALVVAGEGITATYDDGGGTLTIGLTTALNSSFETNINRIVVDESWGVLADEDFNVPLSE